MSGTRSTAETSACLQRLRCASAPPDKHGRSHKHDESFDFKGTHACQNKQTAWRACRRRR
jgi:hypothetical protein